jgi:hypothetical protein
MHLRKPTSKIREFFRKKTPTLGQSKTTVPLKPSPPFQRGNRFPWLGCSAIIPTASFSIPRVRSFKSFPLILIISLALNACGLIPPPPTPTHPPDRESLIPPEQVKILPETDTYPLRSLSPEYADPLPLPHPVNTTGAEDSAFILPDGKTLYVWFTPVPNSPLEGQLTDGVTGIYVFHREGNTWSPAERVPLQDPGKLSLDGCAFVLGDLMWFCTAREGYTGLHWFQAQNRDGRWQGWTEANFPPEYEVGELHITLDGQELYFHSARPGGLGGYDIWMSSKSDNSWEEPVNLTAVNSEHSDGWPFVSPDGTELWFTRSIGAPDLWRSKRVNGVWGSPEQMFTHFSAEVSMDLEGNVYFTHHFFKDDVMLEADIYMAEKIQD